MFSSRDSYDPDDDSITYLWEFGDGDSSTQADIYHTYKEPGEYEVKLTVKDTYGAVGIDIVTILVKNRPPFARGLILPRRVFQGQIVYFMGFGWDMDGHIVEYHWRSNIDGFLSDKSSFSTDKLSSGRHMIYFKVKDDKGLWSRESRESVIVSER